MMKILEPDVELPDPWSKDSKAVSGELRIVSGGKMDIYMTDARKKAVARVDSIEDFFSDEKYDTRVKIYGDGKYQVSMSNNQIFTIPREYKHTTQSTEEMLPDYWVSGFHGSHNDVIRRSKNQIQDLILLNEDLQWFVTVTIDPGRYPAKDATALIKTLSNWLKNQVKRKGLKYVLVPELMRDGKIHFHGLTNDVLNMVDSGTRLVHGFKKPMRLETVERRHLEGQVTSIVYNIQDWKYGFSTAIPRYGKPTAVVCYITKYITKQTGEEKIFGKRFWSSKNLEHYPMTLVLNQGMNKYYDLPHKEYGFSGCDARFKFENHMGEIDGNLTEEENMTDPYNVLNHEN